MTFPLDTENRGNGKKVFSPTAFNPDSALRPNAGGSEAKIIMETGKEERGIYFKGDFDNADEVKAVLLAYKEADKYHIQWLKEMILDYVAAKTSIKARRTNTFATILTGVWNDENLNKRLFQSKREQEEVRK